MAGIRIIIVDDERDFLDSIRRGLFTAGYRNLCLKSDPCEVAAMVAEGQTYDIALIDLTMPHMSGIELLRTIKQHSPATECIMVTAVNEANIAVDCIKNGAYDYLVKPISRDDLILKLGHAQERKRLLDLMDLREEKTVPTLNHPQAFRDITTHSPRMFKLLKQAELHAVSETPVLITGESGTGKELLARAIHQASCRAKRPFLPVNMASLSANFFDAEFFGHTRGAFTGATRERAGYLESANHGTLFLDEIGTLPFDLQGKLLRVLQEGEFNKIGTSRLQRIDLRFVAATNEDLHKAMARGTFRKDLYYRLKGAWLHLPPLRERPEDIPLLAARFLQELKGETPGATLEEEALTALMAYDFPGNIRELKAILHTALNLAGDAPIGCQLLPDDLRVPKKVQQAPRSRSGGGIKLKDVEKSHILDIYDQTQNNKAETARILDIGLNTLRRKLASYGQQ